MSHDVQQVRSFEHPGEGRKRAVRSIRKPLKRLHFCSATGRGGATC
jgi:hypothetical protein